MTEDAEIVTHLEEGEGKIRDDSDACVAENDRTAVPVADDSGLSSQSNVPTPEEVVTLVEEEEDESVHNALTTPAAATEESPPPPAVILPDIASSAVTIVESSTQSEESPAASVPLDAAAPSPTQSDEHEEARVSPTSLVEQGTFGIATPTTATTTASASSAAAAALPGTAFLPAENTNDGETKNEEHCDSGVVDQHQQPTIFVNHGLAAWEESRRQWLNHQDEQADGTNNNNNMLRNNPNLEHAVPLNVDEIIDVVFASPRQLRANGGKGQNFPQPVTLPQMVDILQDLWEAEGLDV